MKKVNNSRRGFTLIELMIVIAIIGVLAAIAIPNFNRARKNAKSKACMANMRTIESAVEMYNMETVGGVMSGTLSLEKLTAYFSGNKVPECPEVDGLYSFTEGEKSTTVSCKTHGTVDYPVAIDALP